MVFAVRCLLACVALACVGLAAADEDCAAEELVNMPIIDDVHYVVGQRPAAIGKGPLMIGGIAGSGTRSVIQLFHTLGVHAVGDSRWDSHIGLSGQTLGCQFGLNYLPQNLPEHVLEYQASQIYRDVDTYKSQHPFEGHCYGENKLVCDCNCHEEEAPLATAVDAGQPWGFKQPETMFVAPVLQAIFPNGTFILVVRHGKDSAVTEGAQSQLNCERSTAATVLSTLRRWAEVHAQLIEWAQAHAHGESFFVLRTEDLLNPARTAALVPLLRRILVSVGVPAPEDAQIEDALQSLRGTSLGSDTSHMALDGPDVAVQVRRQYGKWRPRAAEFDGADSESLRVLHGLGYDD
eukprot:m.74902 g.74902  ORF g.74902 m.74902 type:complete len:349 (-) comp7786_c0_seq1:96-1142(-)